MKHTALSYLSIPLAAGEVRPVAITGRFLDIIEADTGLEMQVGQSGEWIPAFLGLQLTTVEGDIFGEILFRNPGTTAATIQILFGSAEVKDQRLNVVGTRAGQFVSFAEAKKKGFTSAVTSLTAAGGATPFAAFPATVGTERIPDTAAAYDNATVYSAGEWATDGGISYVSLQDTNEDHTPAASPTWWAVVVASGPVAAELATYGRRQSIYVTNDDASSQLQIRRGFYGSTAVTDETSLTSQTRVAALVQPKTTFRLDTDDAVWIYNATGSAITCYISEDFYLAETL